MLNLWRKWYEPGVKQLVEKAKSILDSYQCGQGLLVFILPDTQAEHNYLSKEALIQISQGLDVPLC